MGDICLADTLQIQQQLLPYSFRGNQQEYIKSRVMLREECRKWMGQDCSNSNGVATQSSSEGYKLMS
jgi:hypothetical protein